MGFFEEALRVAREAMTTTGGGEQYEPRLRTALAALESEWGELLSEADYVLVRDASSNADSDLDRRRAERLRSNHGWSDFKTRDILGSGHGPERG